ncbi:protein of unknown function [Streptomyces sp. KY70]|nr:protein of unknown function [Streptomyces sp. KY70]
MPFLLDVRRFLRWLFPAMTYLFL